MDEGGIQVVGVPVGTGECTIENTIRIVRDGGAEQLAWVLPQMPDKQAASLTATGSLVQRTAYVERVMDTKLSLPACRRADNGAMWMLEVFRERPGMAEKSSFLEEVCMAERLILLPQRRGQASLSTGSEGFGMSSRRSVKDVRIDRELGSKATGSPG